MDGEQKAGQQRNPRRFQLLQDEIEQADAGSMEQKLAQVVSHRLQTGKGVEGRQKSVMDGRIVAQIDCGPNCPETGQGKPLNAVVSLDVGEVVPGKMEVQRGCIESKGDAEQKGVRQKPLPRFDPFREAKQGAAMVHRLASSKQFMEEQSPGGELSPEAPRFMAQFSVP